MADLTKDQLAELGKKFWERQQKDIIRTKAVAQALAQLKKAHEKEYDGYLATAKKALGI